MIAVNSATALTARVGIGSTHLGWSLIGIFTGVDMAGSLIVGAAQTWGGFYLPETAMVIMNAVMGAILIFRPWGLFGEEE